MTLRNGLRWGRQVRIGEVLPSIQHAVAKQGLRRIEQVDSLERGEMRIAIAEAVASELAQAYAEQRAGHAMYLLGEDDILFARRWAAWVRCRVATEAWRLDPENAAAEAALDANGGQITIQLAAAIRERLDTRPIQVAEVSLRDAPDGWPSSILSWSAAIESIIESRWANRSRRQPGEDAD